MARNTAVAAKAPPVIVIFGDEEYQKSKALVAARDELLPPSIDASLALSEYDRNGAPLQAAAIKLEFEGDSRRIHVHFGTGLISIEGSSSDWLDDGL